ncbi:hypothetical protein JCM11641_006381 [Rhodosporidiobolus odoratus]
MDDDDWEDQNAKAKAFLVLMMGPSMVPYIKRVEGAAEAWGKIKTRCEPDSVLAGVTIQQNLDLLRLRQGDDISEYVSKFDSLVERLAQTGTTFNEHELGRRLLASLDLADPRFSTLFHKAALGNAGQLRYAVLTSYLLGLDSLEHLRREGERTIEANLARSSNPRSPTASSAPTSSANKPKPDRCINCRKPGPGAAIVVYLR